MRILGEVMQSVYFKSPQTAWFSRRSGPTTRRALPAYLPGRSILFPAHELERLTHISIPRGFTAPLYF